MNKFLQGLMIKKTNYRVPIIQEMKSENWDLSISSRQCSSYEEIWSARLIYENNIRMANDSLVPEAAIKEQLLKEIEWQIYGDVYRMLNFLTKAVLAGDKETSLEIIKEIKKEIRG